MFRCAHSLNHIVVVIGASSYVQDLISGNKPIAVSFTRNIDIACQPSCSLGPLPTCRFQCDHTINTIGLRNGEWPFQSTAKVV